MEEGLLVMVVSFLSLRVLEDIANEQAVDHSDILEYTST